MATAWDAGQTRRRNAALLAGLAGLIAVLIAAGAIFVVRDSSSATPNVPPAPPGAQRLWASQSTPELGGNQITSLALYRLNAPPSTAIAYYRRTLPGHGGTIGRFEVVVHSAAAAALPTALQHLPSAFASGAGARTTARYTFTEYAKAGADIGIAVDLRRPHGPTLVFVDMLSG